MSIIIHHILDWIFRDLKTYKYVLNLSTIYLDQIMNLVGLYHTSTFGPFQPPPLAHLVISIGLLQMYCCCTLFLTALSFYLSFYVWWVLCRQTSIKWLGLKSFLIIAIQMMLFSRYYSFDSLDFLVYTKASFHYLAFVLYRNNVCFTSILPLKSLWSMFCIW